MNIHPTAVVSSQAMLANDVEIGPFCVIEPDVHVDAGTRLASHVVLKQGTTLGRDNQVFDGAVLGGMPQHLNMPPEPGRLVVGRGNIIRENTTLHRSLSRDGFTRVGDGNLLMVGSHVGHDCVVGNNVVLTNHVLLAGHVEVGDRAYFGGAAAVHQFCRIGQLTMIGGMARVAKDVPPYMLLDGDTCMVVGLNRVGLRRAGYTQDEIAQLKAAYRVIYRHNLTWNDVLASLALQFTDGPAAALHEFLTGGSRGFVQERRTPPGATLRIHREDDEAALRVQSRAG